MKFLEKIFGSDEKVVAKMQKTVDEINSLEPEMKKLKDADFPKKTEEFKKKLEKKETKLDDLLPEAFALVREAARRVIGERHYDVQLTGGITLHQGRIAEMKTGEGKTLT